MFFFHEMIIAEYKILENISIRSLKIDAIKTGYLGVNKIKMKKN